MREGCSRGIGSVFLVALVIGSLEVPASAATTSALWHTDEISGTSMTDSSGQGNDGATRNVTFVTPGSDGAGGAYSFDGVDSRVIVADSMSLNPGGEDISITMAVRFSQVPSASVGDYDLLRKGGASIYKIEIFSSGQAHCRFTGTIGTKGITFGPNLADGSWHTITCTKTAGAIRLTVDGSTDSRAVTIGSISNTSPLAVGGKANAKGDWYLGSMDEVGIQVG